MCESLSEPPKASFLPRFLPWVAAPASVLGSFEDWYSRCTFLMRSWELRWRQPRGKSLCPSASLSLWLCHGGKQHLILFSQLFIWHSLIMWIFPLVSKDIGEFAVAPLKHFTPSVAIHCYVFSAIIKTVRKTHTSSRGLALISLTGVLKSPRRQRH